MAKSASLLEASLTALFNHPVIGAGAGESPELIGRYKPTDSPYLRSHFEPLPYYQSSPSALATAAAELGLIGLALLLALFTIAAIKLLKATQNHAQTSDNDDNDETNNDNDELDHLSLWGLCAALTTTAMLFIICPVESLPATMSAAAFVLAAAAARGPATKTSIDIAPAARSSRLAIAAIPLAAAAATSLFSLRLGIGDYYRQWANLYYMRQSPQAFAQSTALYKSALSFNPGDDRALVALAASQQRQGKTKDAINSLDAALELAPHHARLRMQRGKLESARNHFKSATTWFTAALDLHPNYIDARLGIAQVHANLHEWEDARRVLRAALELSPPPEKEAQIHYDMAKTFIKEKRFGEAERSLDLAAKIARGLKLNLNLATLYEEIDFLKARQKVNNAHNTGDPHNHKEGQKQEDGHGGHGGHNHKLPPINVDDHAIPLNLPED